MKSDTDSQERQRTIVSRSTVECMPPSLPPPPKKKKLWSIFKTEIDLLCWTCHAQVKIHVSHVNTSYGRFPLVQSLNIFVLEVGIPSKTPPRLEEMTNLGGMSRNNV